MLHLNEVRDQLQQILNKAVCITGDKGNLQLFDERTSSLRIAAQVGFAEGFLSFFDETHEGQGACGAALLHRSRVVVPDVAKHPIFAETEARQVMLDAQARAVHSTPLQCDGQVLGVLSCHYYKPTQPSRKDLRAIDKVAADAAALLSSRLRPASGRVDHREWQCDRLRTGYSVFIRQGNFVTFLGGALNEEEGVQRIRGLSSVEPGEFVLFDRLRVTAIAQRGTAVRLA
jgi:transcriptional regulator with GAF, ATPase, and Fis domain